MVTRTETVYVYPPPELMRLCDRPVWAGRTYRDLVGYSLKLQSALEECNVRIRAIREWAAESRGE